MDRPPLDTSKSIELIKKLSEKSARALVPLILNEGFNVISLEADCNSNLY